MSARPLSSALSPFQQAAIARALPGRSAAGLLHNAMVSADGRQFAITAARPVGAGDWETSFSNVVTRRASARVDRLLPVVATGCHDGCHWVAYETGPAKPLVADGWRRWPAQLALDLVSDVANALDDAAAFGVLPYELLPSAIFMDPRLGPLLGDLGAAREAVGSPPADNDPGRAFTPPEVIAGGVAGARSGVYVCGALLYALLSGAPPRHDPVTHSRSDLPEEIDLILARALAPDTLERYRSAAEFRDGASRALGLQAVPAPEPEPLAPLADADWQSEPIAEPDPEPLADDWQSEPIAEPEPEELADDWQSEPTAEPEPEPIAEPEPLAAAASPDPEPFISEPEPFLSDPREPVTEPMQKPPRRPWPALRTELLPEPPPLDDNTWRPPVSPAMRWLRIGLVVGGVVLAAVIGFQAGQPDPPARASGAQVSGADLSITLPAGWSLGEARGRELLAAYPNSDFLGGLMISRGDGASTPRTGSDPVRLGELDMWRDTSGAPELVRYVLPTSAGPLQISCKATPGGPKTTLPACERSISTLSLNDARVLPLTGVAPKPGTRAALERLRRERLAGRTALSRARTPQGQRAAALSLQRSSSRAGRRLEQVSGGAAVPDATARVARAYGALAASAGGTKAGWQKSLAAVRDAEDALARALKQQD